MSPNRIAAATFAVAFSVHTLGCARVTQVSEVSVQPSSKPPVQLDTTGGVITKRNYAASWIQLGNELVVQLSETRQCQSLLHTPVVRTDKIRKRPDSTLGFSIFLAVGAAAISAFAFRNPSAFGTQITPEGETFVDLRPARRIGITSAVAGGLLLARSGYDIARSIDKTVYTEAYQLTAGAQTVCAQPSAPLARHDVHLVIGEYKIAQTTNSDGLARFQLPTESSLPKPAVQSVSRVVQNPILPAAVRIDNYHAVAVDIRTPYHFSGDAHVGPRAGDRVDLTPPRPLWATPLGGQ